MKNKYNIGESSGLYHLFLGFHLKHFLLRRGKHMKYKTVFYTKFYASKLTVFMGPKLSGNL